MGGQSSLVPLLSTFMLSQGPHHWWIALSNTNTTFKDKQTLHSLVMGPCVSGGQVEVHILFSVMFSHRISGPFAVRKTPKLTAEPMAWLSQHSPAPQGHRQHGTPWNTGSRARPSLQSSYHQTRCLPAPLLLGRGHHSTVGNRARYPAPPIPRKQKKVS